MQRFQYTYDKNGMRTGMTDNDGTHDYVYDALYQITRATHPMVQNPVTELVEVEQFQYDEVGNWLNDNRIHNDLNQLIEDDSCFYSYDEDGNMTGKISKSSGDITSLTWDIENKLVEVRKPGLLVQYEYDATGRRVTKNVNPDGIGTGSITTQFRYDGDDLILEMNDSDSVVANYTFGPGIDDPLLMHRDNNNYYYLKDGLGSVRALTDSIGNTVKEYNYSVFGKITEESGDSNLWNPFTYTGREWEKELGIYFYRARYFDPVMGRFLSEDPLKFEPGNENFLNYNFNNPINGIDPFGLWCISLPSDKVRNCSKEIGREKVSRGFAAVGIAGGEDGLLFSYIKVDVYKVFQVEYKITERKYCCDKECDECGKNCRSSCGIQTGPSRKEIKKERRFFYTEPVAIGAPVNY